jgi:hypothetical protein
MTDEIQRDVNAAESIKLQRNKCGKKGICDCKLCWPVNAPRK